MPQHKKKLLATTPEDEVMLRMVCLGVAGLSYTGTKDVSTGNLTARAEKLRVWVLEGAKEFEVDDA